MQFDDCLKLESMKLFRKLQAIIEEIRLLHEKNEATMRQSFYKQLCDAIASIKGTYMQYFEVEPEQGKAPGLSLSILRKKLQDKNKIIEDLKDELSFYRQNEIYKLEFMKEECNEKITNLEKDIAALKKDNEKLQKSITGLEEDLQLCEKTNTLLEGEMLAMKQRMEQDQKLIAKLTELKDKLSLDLYHEKEAIQDMIEQHKKDIEETKKIMDVPDLAAKSLKDIRRETEERGMIVRRIPEMARPSPREDKVTHCYRRS
ncbi:uncharacterized protein C10orf67, mitochondrial-like [Gracilinanus agilis]|uniref:uncharacterized protein C10orf67, mitochondrial-like n=1 Tax=Gracilinanus agilis TaxID=191870 RepID=UPI001CFCDC49|nr:uncharacterized protein C10orf67, mitochondrial-like [Gracilinanus agilis]